MIFYSSFAVFFPWPGADVDMGQVTKVRLSCYLILLSNDSKTRCQDSRTFTSWPIYCSYAIVVILGYLNKIDYYQTKENHNRVQTVTVISWCILEWNMHFWSLDNIIHFNLGVEMQYFHLQ